MRAFSSPRWGWAEVLNDRLPAIFVWLTPFFFPPSTELFQTAGVRGVGVLATPGANLRACNGGVGWAIPASGRIRVGGQSLAQFSDTLAPNVRLGVFFLRRRIGGDEACGRKPGP